LAYPNRFQHNQKNGSLFPVARLSISGLVAQTVPEYSLETEKYFDRILEGASLNIREMVY
jgi:hypothetical protein